MDNNKHLGRIFAYVLVNTIIGLGFLVIIFVRGKKFVCVRYWRYAFKFSMPLVFHGLSMVILAQSDRTMITAMRDVSETGIYSLVYSFSMIALVVISSIQSVWIPWFSDKMQRNEKKSINKNVQLYMEIVLVMILGIMLVAPEILKLMAPKEYWSGIILIPPIVLASFMMFLYSISVDLEYYYKSTKSIALNTIIAASVNICLNSIFIPLYGALAAAFTTVFAYLISFIIHYTKARKLDSELFPFSIYIKPLAVVIIGVILSYVLLEVPIFRWAIAIIGFIIYLVISILKKRFSSIF
jgi:O-antigen/teichoic acid export membrane protein